MKGRHLIEVGNRRVRYKFSLERNITILRGDSATGKTTLIDLVSSYQRNGESSGVTLKCDKPCVALPTFNWELNLSAIHDSIVFIDEGAAFITSRDFARAVRDSDNYYVIATRMDLPHLPYSTKEIYKIRNTAGNRIQGTKRLYSEFYPLHPSDLNAIARPDLVIVEDSNSGFEFFRDIFERYNIPCISAGGKSNVAKEILASGKETVLVIADGAAFGPEIKGVVSTQKIKNVIIYLPESFEWLILKSDIIRDPDTKAILEDPSPNIDSRLFFSWEQFFTKQLQAVTSRTEYEYRKGRLNPIYLRPNEEAKILDVMPKIL